MAGFPVLSYLFSEKGYIVPPGYMHSILSDLYAGKHLEFAGPDNLRAPSDVRLQVVDADELPFDVLTQDEWSTRAKEGRKQKRGS